MNSVEIILNDYPTQKDVPKCILDTFELTIIKNQETKISQSKNFFLNKRMNQALKNIRYPSNFGVYNFKIGILLGYFIPNSFFTPFVFSINFKFQHLKWVVVPNGLLNS